MKGKAKEKRKIGKAILIGMGFFLTIVLTFTTTLAWFYDSDWASKYISMAGTVGIEIRKEDGTRTSGSGNLYFHINSENGKAYPGQAIDVSASVYNNGGKSGVGGSDCYVRAHFAVYTNIGKLPVATDYVGGTESNAYKAAVAQYRVAHELADNAEVPTETLEAAGIKAADYDGGENANAYKTDLANAETESEMSSEALYAFLETLVDKQNTLNTSSDPNLKTDYYWIYHKQTGALPLSNSGIKDTDIEYYIDGQKVKDTTHDPDNENATSVSNVTTVTDKGYFYLCKDSLGVLKPLAYDDDAVFLWNNTFIVPWKLTNNSADKLIFVGITFQAIQTFIPQMVMSGTTSTGVIWGDPNNQVPEEECTYNSPSVQTVFNSCNFKEIETSINVNGKIVDFSKTTDFDKTSELPTT